MWRRHDHERLARQSWHRFDGWWRECTGALSTDEFDYVTITETKSPREGLVRSYDELLSVAALFSQQLATLLLVRPTHLRRSTRAREAHRLAIGKGRLAGFFSALRPVDGPSRPLVYALIGLYVIAGSFRPALFHGFDGQRTRTLADFLRRTIS